MRRGQRRPAHTAGQAPGGVPVRPPTPMTRMTTWNEPVSSLPRGPRHAASFESRLGAALWIALAALVLVLSAV